MLDTPPKRIDTHFHALVLGDDPAFKKWGHISEKLRAGITYDFILKYTRIKKSKVSDLRIREETVKVIRESKMDQVVCLALDPVYDKDGNRQEGDSNVWVDNEYILDLQREVGDKVLFGASVHPFDPLFKKRVEKYVKEGAVLLKWLPSSQQINLDHELVKKALVFLAKAGADGGPLPLLLHVGPEGAIPPTDPKAYSNDYLRWGVQDWIRNRFRPKAKRLKTPNIAKVNANLRAGLKAGATIIFAHCGLPYFAPRFVKFFEHSDFKPVRKYLELNKTGGLAGKSYADVSAVVTPFRKSYFKDIRKLPEKYILAGSDWPVPVFELSADLREHASDFVAIVRGDDISRIIIPEDNLLDVNWSELEHAFGKGHPMFSNAQDILP